MGQKCQSNIKSKLFWAFRFQLNVLQLQQISFTIWKHISFPFSICTHIFHFIFSQTPILTRNVCGFPCDCFREQRMVSIGFEQNLHKFQLSVKNMKKCMWLETFKLKVNHYFFTEFLWGKAYFVLQNSNQNKIQNNNNYGCVQNFRLMANGAQLIALNKFSALVCCWHLYLEHSQSSVAMYLMSMKELNRIHVIQVRKTMQKTRQIFQIP